MLPGMPLCFRVHQGRHQRHAESQGAALQPMAGAPWPSQPTPYASAFIAPPAFPMYKPSYMSTPPARQDIEARELEVQRMTRTRNLNAVRDARVTTATSVAGSRHSRKKEQSPRQASSQTASQRSQTPSGAPPSGIEVISTCITQTVVPPPVSSQDGANQEMKAMVQNIVKSSRTQLGVIPQDTPTQSQAFK